MPEHHAKHGKRPNVLAAIGVAGILVLLILTLYLGSKLESLEDQLAYQPPAASVSPATGADATPRQSPTDAKIVYVPVYSHIYAMGGQPILLESTLSIRNTDPDNAITISSVRYFDTGGKLIQEFLDQDVQLGPLESAEILVEKSDRRGGSGANFLVSWASDRPVHEPLIEAIMVGQADNQGRDTQSRRESGGAADKCSAASQQE